MDPVSIAAASGIGLLIVVELIKIIRKSHYKSTCMVKDKSDESE